MVVDKVMFTHRSNRSPQVLLLAVLVDRLKRIET
jgi:hypothetical protein